MKILYIAGREAAFSRTRIVLNALRQNGFEVVECLPPNKAFSHYPGLLLKALYIFQQQCATATFGQRFTAILNEVLGARRAAP